MKKTNWEKGKSSAKLDEMETVNFENLVKSWMNNTFNDWHSYDRLGDEETVQVILNDCTGFLFESPGARRV